MFSENNNDNFLFCVPYLLAKVECVLYVIMHYFEEWEAIAFARGWIYNKQLIQYVHAWCWSIFKLVVLSFGCHSDYPEEHRLSFIFQSTDLIRSVLTL